MAYGRVKHKKRDRIGSRSVSIRVQVGRDTTSSAPRYQAYACLARTGGAARSGNRKTWSQTCTADHYARTPQSAIAKATKAMAGVIARRNRTKRRRAARGWRRGAP